MAARQDIPGTDTVGGYGARYQYFDPVIWIMLTRVETLRQLQPRFSYYDTEELGDSLIANVHGHKYTYILTVCLNSL